MPPRAPRRLLSLLPLALGCVVQGPPPVVIVGVLCQAHDNFWGKLGDSSLREAETARPVPGLHDVLSVSDSGTATCAVRADGVVLCWGRNRDRVWRGPGMILTRSSTAQNK